MGRFALTLALSPRRGRAAGRKLLQPGPQPFTAKVVNDGARSIIASGVVARSLAVSPSLFELKDERFKDFAEHLGVNRDFLVEGSVFANGEVVSLEEILEKMPESGIADFDPPAAIEGI